MNASRSHQDACNMVANNEAVVAVYVCLVMCVCSYPVIILEW